MDMDMDMDITPIREISETDKNEIKRKTAYGLPDHPASYNMRAETVKSFFYRALTDGDKSFVSLLNRVIREANAALGGVVTNVDYDAGAQKTTVTFGSGEKAELAGPLRGEPGEDGVSPTVAVERVTGGFQFKVTDVNGTASFFLPDGEKGEKGEKGDPGAKGNRGDDVYAFRLDAGNLVLVKAGDVDDSVSYAIDEYGAMTVTIQ